MAVGAPVRLPATAPELAAAHAMARHADPALERLLRAVASLADEKVLLAASAAFWAASRLADGGMPGDGRRRAADHVLRCAAASTTLAYLLKSAVDRERPNQAVARDPRRGIPRSGAPRNSFPSGHALALGALAAAASRVAPTAVRLFIWPTAVALAAARFLLLAHWLTDIAAGFGMGVALERAVFQSAEAAGRRREAGRSGGSA
jgi:undecaprenyl-diphosphatase